MILWNFGHIFLQILISFVRVRAFLRDRIWNISGEALLPFVPTPSFVGGEYDEGPIGL